MNYRMEADSIGTKQVPADAYYGVQSLRGAENFKITGHMLHPLFIKNMAKKLFTQFFKQKVLRFKMGIKGCPAHVCHFNNFSHGYLIKIFLR